MLGKVESRMQAAEAECKLLKQKELMTYLADGIYLRDKVQPIMRVSLNVYHRETRRVMKVSGILSSLVTKYREISKLVELYMLTLDTNVDSTSGKHSVMMYMLHCELTDFVLI